MKLITKKVNPNETMIDAILNDMVGRHIEILFTVLISDELKTSEIEEIVVRNEINIPKFSLLRGRETMSHIKEGLDTMVRAFIQTPTSESKRLDIYLHTKSYIDFSKFVENKNIVVHQYIESIQK